MGKEFGAFREIRDENAKIENPTPAVGTRDRKLEGKSIYLLAYASESVEKEPPRLLLSRF